MAGPSHPQPAPDFQVLFESAPGLYLVLRPDFTIVAASDAYLLATMTQRDAMVGRDIFEVFPDNPEDPAADGVRNLRASLERVRDLKAADAMPVQKYDIPRPQEEGGGFEARYWSPANSPVFSQGELAFIIHRVEDVTEFVRFKNSSEKKNEAEIFRRTQEVAQTYRNLLQAHDRTNALLRAVTDNVDDVILVKDLEGRYLTINPGGARLLGMAVEAILGRDDREFFGPEMAAGIRARDREIADSGETRSYEEQVSFGGNMRTFLTLKGPYRDSAGRIIGLIGISRDITERKLADEEIRLLNAELERRVASRTAELEAANRELEAFSYSVSHDLRAPLRSMDGFAQALFEDYGAQLDDTARDYIQRVRDASQRMAGLIEGILELSRIARQDMRHEPVDLSAIARDVIGSLAAQEPQRKVDVHIAADLVEEGDRRLLHVVLENLLGNAWKYTSKHPRARIEFGRAANAAGEARCYFVRDDGAGFDMQYSSKLFGAFQRMHGITEFAGHGVGLATVQRIVRRHGGRIWAEAETEKGATFFFTLWEPAPRLP